MKDKECGSSRTWSWMVWPSRRQLSE